MQNISQNITPPDASLFFSKNDANDVRLGEIVPQTTYEAADIVIIGCPQDEGVRRNGGRLGAAQAPDKIREQFYKLTPFGIKAKIFDIGNTIISGSLEEIHEAHTATVKQLLKDNKIIISLGGGNDLSYADGCAMADVYGADGWAGVNIDAHFDVRADSPRNSGTPYRQLLDEKLINPRNFFEIGYQAQVNSETYFKYLQDLKVNLISLNEYQATQGVELKKIGVDSDAIFWGFDVDAVRSSDAPGVSAPSPLGLTATEFCSLAKYAADNPNTKIIEFTEVNPNFDIDNRTAKLVAVAMHKFCSALPVIP